MPLKAKIIRWTFKYAPSFIKTRAASKIMGDYGEMVEIKFDPENKHLIASLELAGESDPIEIEITDYEFVESGEKTKLIVRQATVDREWINLLIRDLLIGTPISLPADKVKLIRGILKE